MAQVAAVAQVLSLAKQLTQALHPSPKKKRKNDGTGTLEHVDSRHRRDDQRRLGQGESSPGSVLPGALRDTGF